MNRLLALALAAMLCSLSAAAQPAAPLAQVAAPPGVMRVGVFLDAPFVMHRADGQGFDGMATELWTTVAGALGVQSDYAVYATVAELLDAVEAGRIDIAVADLTITADRLRRMEFTQPWYQTGLRLMVNEARHVGPGDLVAALRASGHMRVYAWLASLIVLATVVLTLIDRRLDTEFPRIWRQGLAESLYHVMSVATSGKTSHKPLFGSLGTVVAAMWMLCGVGVVAYVTSSLASVMTATHLEGVVHGPADLANRSAGVLSGSVGETYAAMRAIDDRAYPNLDAAVAGLLRGEVAAVIGDEPVLTYYDRMHPELPITEVGEVFQPMNYGFALPLGSAWTRPVSAALLELHEGGLTTRLRRRYFGAAS